MSKVTFLAVIAVLLVSVTACILSANRALTGQQGAEVRISQVTTAVGGHNPEEEQILSYSITVVNDQAEEVYIKSLQPVLSYEVGRRLLDRNTVVLVEKYVAPRAFVEVQGRISFDTRSTSKEQIISWEPMITGAKLTYERTLSTTGTIGS